MDDPADRLDRSLLAFMRHYWVLVNPILYRTEYRGRAFPDSEIMVMMMLSIRSPQSPSQISRALGMQKGSLTSVLRRLEKLGFIRRRANPDDDRSYVTAMTESGAAFVAHLARQRRDGFRRLFGDMPPEDIAAAANGFDLIAAYLREMEETKMTETKEAEGTHLNWYQAASDEDRREYDQFGPWVTEVKTEEDMPKRFRPHYAECRNARFLLKVPRDADRRNVRPGMDLYVAVVAIRDDGVTLMNLRDGQIEKRELAWSQIGAIGSYADKLLGVWTLFLKDGSRTGFNYNKASGDVVDHATDFVRDRLALPDAPGSAVVRPQSTVTLTDDDLFFGSSLLELRHRGPEPLVPIYFEPQDRSCRGEAGQSAVSTGVLILDTPHELIIVNRDAPTRRPEEAWHASNDIFVPYGRITGYELASPADDSHSQFMKLVLHLDRLRISQPCLGVPQPAIDMLKARGVPRV